MALVSPAPTLPHPMSSIVIHPEIIVPGITAAREEIVEESVEVEIEKKVYVALGKEIEKNKSVLHWAIQNSVGKRICIIHVHQRAQWIPMMGTKFPANRVKELQVKAYWEAERESMLNSLDHYLHLCFTAGVQAEKDYIEMDSIEKGIVELIVKHGIKKLIMGAAGDKCYSKKMKDPKSKKAISVRDQAPASCKILFVCKGKLIHIREEPVGGSETESSSQPLSPSSQATSSTEAGGSDHYRTQSARQSVSLLKLAKDYRRVKSLNANANRGRLSNLRNRADTEGSADESDNITGTVLRRSSSVLSDSPLVPESGLESTLLSKFKEDLNRSSPPSVLDVNINDRKSDQVEQMMREAASSRREAYKEALRRSQAEKDAVEAIRKEKASNALFSEELKRRKEIEEALEKAKADHVEIKIQRDEIKEALEINTNQIPLLEKQIAESELTVKELEEKIISAVDLLQSYRKERDELQVERDIALKEAEELRKSEPVASTLHIRQFVTNFSFSDIVEATNNFNPSLKIGEGGYGSIYKGFLRHTPVAVKMLNSDSLQGPSEFQQEVGILGKMRHPNLVTLVGACPEAWTLIYEYLPNGSLDDRLNCKDNSPPLPWQTRIRIATELCSCLIFLHSCKPQGIVHGDLKPGNILLDANFACKLSDFGLCRLLSDKSVVCRTSPKGTFGYLDPEFYATGELTPKSDVYSFGIIVLQLLTGRYARGIANEVRSAIDAKRLNHLLDPLAGDWPFVQAEQLANLALRCCQLDRKNRPDLETEVWRVLEPMRAACGRLPSSGLGSEVQFQSPSYFICPIFQEVMQDPHVAADGFTYEAEALRGWLDCGNTTSPMTNLELLHKELVPNHALRSAIQEWLQQH